MIDLLELFTSLAGHFDFQLLASLLFRACLERRSFFESFLNRAHIGALPNVIRILALFLKKTQGQIKMPDQGDPPKAYLAISRISTFRLLFFQHRDTFTLDPIELVLQLLSFRFTRLIVAFDLLEGGFDIAQLGASDVDSCLFSGMFLQWFAGFESLLESAQL